MQIIYLAYCGGRIFNRPQTYNFCHYIAAGLTFFLLWGRWQEKADPGQHKWYTD